MKNMFWQFVKFGLVGVLNTLVNYIVYALIITILGTDYYILGSLLGFLISVFHAYVWQSFLVFKENENLEKRVWWKVLIKTYIAYSFTGLLLNNIFLILMLDIVHIDNFMGPIVNLLEGFGVVLSNYEVAAYIAPFLNMAISIPLNFVINKFWAYKQKESYSEKN